MTTPMTPEPRKIFRKMGNGRALTIGYLVVHFGYFIFMLVIALHGGALSDTYYYQQWSATGFSENFQPPPWVYPLLGLLPIWISGLFGPGPFLVIWFLLIASLNGLALGFLTQWGRSRSGVIGGWWWLGFTALLGYIGFARLDGVTAPIALIALCLGLASPFIASLLLSAATWMKIWPAAILLPLLIISKKRLQVILGGVIITLGVLVTAIILQVHTKLLDFLTVQGNRGMQVEATFTTPWLWIALFGDSNTRIYRDLGINSVQVDGPGTTFMAALMTPTFILVVIILAVFIFWVQRRYRRQYGHPNQENREDLFLISALATVTAFIVFNKVGSPQFILWLGPVVAVGLRRNARQWRTPAIFLSLIAGTTFLVYPVLYDLITFVNPIVTVVLTIRNIFLVTLFAWTIKQIISFGNDHQGKSSTPASHKQKPKT